MNDDARDHERAALLDRIERLERAARPLDPGATRRRRLRQAVVALSERFLRRADTLRGFQETEGNGIGLLRAPISEHGLSPEAALELLEREVIHPGANPASPGIMAYIPGGGIYHAALGDYLAAVSNKYAGVFFTGPGPVRMENLVLRWVADVVGYPAGAGGNIASGGSVANLMAVATARDAHGLRAPTSQRRWSTSPSRLTTASPRRCASRDWPRRRCARCRPTRPSACAPTPWRQAIAADRRAGLRPWLIIASAGTTDTGAIDPLDAIATVAQREGCWFHVDAAYGGFFLLTEHGRRLLKGIERSDSAVLDPHKSLFLPWGAGMLVVSDVEHLAATHSYSGAYMQDALRDESEVSPSDVSPELSKPFRALRMWLPLVLLGTKPFQAALDEKLLLARYFHREVRALGFEVGPAPELSIVIFRWVPPGVSPERADDVNQAIVDRVRRDGRIFLSSTLLEGRFTLRLVALGFRTHRRTIDLALRVLGEQAAAVGAVRGLTPGGVPGE